MEKAPAPASGSEIHRPKFVRWALMLGIVVVLNLFFFAVRSIIFPAPVYDDFCPASRMPAPMTEQACIAADGTWNAYPPADIAAKTAPVTPNGYCDTTSKCQKPFENAQKDYQLKAFVLMIGFGVISLVIGVLPLGSSIVSTGLSYGGVAALIIGSASYWNEAGNWVRLAIAVIALAALLYIGIKRFKD